jgi:hypothetical protein
VVLEQESVVHSLESSQEVGVWTQPVETEQVSVVHALPSSQEITVWTHPVLVLQLSAVHALPSSQLSGALTHPVVGLQLSAVHALLSQQQRSAITHPLTGSQDADTQAEEGLQDMGVWRHPLTGSQTSRVQALLSQQLPRVWTHPEEGLQLSTVHATPSSQLITLLTQTPLAQVSVVHLLLSQQSTLTFWQLLAHVAPMQESMVQGLLSLQFKMDAALETEAPASSEEVIVAKDPDPTLAETALTVRVVAVIEAQVMLKSSLITVVAEAPSLVTWNTGPTGEERETIAGQPFEQTPSVPEEAMQLLRTALRVNPAEAAMLIVMTLLADIVLPVDIITKKLIISPQAKLCPFAVVVVLGLL